MHAAIITAVLFSFAGVIILSGEEKPAPEGAIIAPGDKVASEGEKKTPPAEEKETKKVNLLREDTRLVNVKGKIMDLKYDLDKSDRSRSAFVPKNSPGYFILLENRNLEKIEEITKRGEKEVLVSGTVTVYKGKNYLLLTRTSVKVK